MGGIKYHGRRLLPQASLSTLCWQAVYNIPPLLSGFGQITRFVKQASYPLSGSFSCYLQVRHNLAYAVIVHVTKEYISNREGESLPAT